MIRREVKSRDAAWAGRAAAWLTAHGVQPNWISLCSVVFALGGAVSVGIATRLCVPWKIFCFLLAIVGIQGRLLCNLLDGMVAIEGGRKTRSGELFNDFEESVFALHPEIGRVKEKLYNMGATYAAMSGSGSALFGLFRNRPDRLDQEFPEMFTFSSLL